MKEATVESVLKRLFDNTPFEYSYEKLSIVVKKRRTQLTTPTDEIQITGVVIDKNEEVIPGVSVIIKGTTLGTATDINGKFVIRIPSRDNIVLQFSCIGMQKKEIAIKDDKELIVIMEESSEVIQEVVVTGIYSRNKESFTGSFSSYSKEDLKMVGTQNIIQSLRSLDPSMLVIESKQWGSDPNRMPDIEIRGKTSIVGLKTEFENDPNQPLFILDGVETTLETIVNLSMDRVASVTILKDAASTAIYGSKAANGVIVVETIQPRSGQLRLSYNGNYKIQFADLSDYNLMNAAEKLEFERLSGRYDDFSSYSNNVVLQKLYNERLAEVIRGVDTYWMSEPLRTVLNHSHNIYIDGGDNAMRYGLGIGYNNSNGVMKGSDRNVISANIDLTYRKKSLLFSNKFSLDVTHTEREPVAFSKFAQANPYFRKKLENGYIPLWLEDSGTQQNSAYIKNPLYEWTIKNTNIGNTIQLRDNFSIEWRIFTSLRATARLGLTKSVGRTEQFKSPKHPDFLETEKLKQGSFSASSSESFSYNGDLNLAFGKIFIEKHQVNLVGGWSFNEHKKKSDGYRVVGFNDDLHQNPAFSTGFSDGQKPTYSLSKSRSTSFFLNANYSFMNRYLMDFNLRADGTSKFGANKRFSSTWAVGLAWNLHNEEFMRKLDIFTNFKIRASIGNPGNQNFDAYQAMKIYRYNVEYQNMFGSSAIIDQFGNKNLNWQRTLDKNIGVDLSILNNRVRLTLDYYRKNTDPLLISIPMPPSVGTSSINANAGRQISSGWNGSLFYTILRKQNMNWSMHLNFRTSKSEYRDIGNKLQELNELGSAQNLVRYYEGASPDDMWAVPSLGIDPATGREMFRKKDGTQTFVYSTDDEIVVGSSRPDVEGVIGSTFYYKGLSVSMSLRYRLGGQVMASALYSKVENIGRQQIYYNQDRRALHDRWQKPGDKAKFKSIKETSSTPMSSRFVRTENTLAGESISIGYESNAKWVRYIGAEGITFRAYMNDIFRLSSFKEERGIDYPFARTISFSLNLRF
ncbi:SusC/RagA family TonB-linked outer membrane protein [Odoribacter splanchnicus]|uniref:SusC/RagA family TonB-linked outer membrane protein n=2 Tax=Odoribacter splanchnicus TaxID=28118 RepID=A0A413ICB7_9BACT|nr:SusC/RagA family TonB-linked outer membrane protein [Odoribacter splanchnicus]RGY06742.1 SusC/RagA family TonB-linked outer membrane protein [Odoribacter splanchnicus]RHL75984.1 SusC/RagA family TonB-linked outer membrane protein [Odoribacter splanchnicus]